MSTRKRRHFTPEQKVAIVRRHLLEQVPVSCREPLALHLTPAATRSWSIVRQMSPKPQEVVPPLIRRIRLSPAQLWASE